MNTKQNQLVKEEQDELDEVTRQMDDAILSLRSNLTRSELEARKARGLKDAYVVLTEELRRTKETAQDLKYARRSRDELYSSRIIVKGFDSHEVFEENIKIGLHTYANSDQIYIMSWKESVCRPFMLDNASTEADVSVKQNGKEYTTHYKLKLKRNIDMDFDTVTGVAQLYPAIEEETETIVGDRFLQELLSRRNDKEFRNIVFSIQKQQGEIIQAPFQQNMIVQGCAGSGKSMIMLHRLPILFYDPNELDSNNLYIISPSVTYIQMAENMRAELEIESLLMGTIHDYYDRLIQKYRRSPEDYGKLRLDIQLPHELTRYVYSSECIHDIQAKMRQAVDDQIPELQKECQIFDIAFYFQQDTFERKIRSILGAVQNILAKNRQVLRQYYQNIRQVLEDSDRLCRSLSNRHNRIQQEIRKKHSRLEKVIANHAAKLSEINEEVQPKRYQQRLEMLKTARTQLLDLQETGEIVDLDKDYFGYMSNLSLQFSTDSAYMDMIRKPMEQIETKDLLSCIEARQKLFADAAELAKNAAAIENPYYEFAPDFTSEIVVLEKSLDALAKIKTAYLDMASLDKVMQTEAYFTELSRNLPDKIYAGIMERLGQKKDVKGRMNALDCSPYLYLQILYCFRGIPAGRPESLVTIDEAQNLAPEELRLISNVNGGNLIFNLFGDVKQHIEHEKGIDSWEEFSDIAPFRLYHMDNNYRNARQITEYCNDRFGMNMRAINLAGEGVHMLQPIPQLKHQLHELFHTSQKAGLSCIIVKDPAEAQKLVKDNILMQSKINDMTQEIQELSINKWNLITIKQAKGLEFGTVIAFSARMTENEKYIAYTRALDELYVADQTIAIPVSHEAAIMQEKVIVHSETTVEKKTQRKKRKKRTTEEALKSSR